MVLAVDAGSGRHGGGGGRGAPRPGKFHERRKGDQLLALWNEAGNEAGRQGMMLMGHGEDDAGTSEAVIESGDGGRAGVALGALLQKKWRWARHCRRSGARRVAAEEVVLGAQQKKKKSLRRCCAKDERQMLEDPAAARETNEHSG
jgi:hypothetical protein